MLHSRHLYGHLIVRVHYVFPKTNGTANITFDDWLCTSSVSNCVNEGCHQLPVHGELALYFGVYAVYFVCLWLYALNGTYLNFTYSLQHLFEPAFVSKSATISNPNDNSGCVLDMQSSILLTERCDLARTVGDQCI